VPIPKAAPHLDPLCPAPFVCLSRGASARLSRDAAGRLQRLGIQDRRGCAPGDFAPWADRQIEEHARTDQQQ